MAARRRSISATEKRGYWASMMRWRRGGREGGIEVSVGRNRPKAVLRHLVEDGALRGPSAANLMRPTFSFLPQRHDHVEFDARTGGTELVDTEGRACRAPVAEVGRHRRVHAVEVADVGEIFR